MSDPFSASRLCAGPYAGGHSSRRGFLRFGLGGFASLPRTDDQHHAGVLQGHVHFVSHVAGNVLIGCHLKLVLAM